MGWRQEPHAAIAMAALQSDILLEHRGYQEAARELAIRLDKYEADLAVERVRADENEVFYRGANEEIALLEGQLTAANEDAEKLVEALHLYVLQREGRSVAAVEALAAHEKRVKE